MAKSPIYLRTPSGACLWLAALGVACLVAQFGSAIFAAPQRASAANVPVTRRDLGDLYAGEMIDQVFSIYNEGNAPLEMERTTTGQLMPSVSDRLVRVGDFRPSNASQPVLGPAAIGLAAPS